MHQDSVQGAIADQGSMHLDIPLGQRGTHQLVLCLHLGGLFWGDPLRAKPRRFDLKAT